MKILPVVFLFILGFFITGSCTAQDSAMQVVHVLASDMQDTTIALDPAFILKDRYASLDSIVAFQVWASKMRDTTIIADPAFVVFNMYAEKDSIANLYGGFASRRDSLVHAFRDSIARIGTALMRSADMQDTTIAIDPSFVVMDVYAARDLAEASRDSLKASRMLAATMQDTTIEIDPSFVVRNVYAKRDQYDAFRDSVWATLADAAKMQDTVIILDPDYIVQSVYASSDRQEAIRDSLARPTIMQDTVILMDPSFVVLDLYTAKDFRDAVSDSLNIIRDSLIVLRDSLFTDSVQRHWAGWKKYDVQPGHDYTLNSQKVLKGKSKAVLQYNVADFYLYLNGEQIRPAASEYDFFTAGCLAFNSDDTLLLNSGLGFKVGVGVGIKIFDERFTGSLHANTRNEQVYKHSQDDSEYMKSIIAEPVSQSLKLRSDPAYGGDVILGEYQASYHKFYQKNPNGEDEERAYTVKIIFRCRVVGGISNRLR